MQAQWRETTIGDQGELLLHGLPFEAGQPVEVLVISKGPGRDGGRGLEGSVIDYRDPFEPVASEDWDAVR